MEKDLQPVPAPGFSEPEPATPAIGAASPVAAPNGSQVAAPRPRGNAARLVNVALAGALVLAIGGVAFAAGRMTAPAASITTGGNFPRGFEGNGQVNPGAGGFQGRPGGQGAFGGLSGGVSLEGTVESVSDTTLTLKTADGQTVQIALNGATTYHSQTDASSSDVVTGAKVLVRLQLGRIEGGGTGPSATAGTGGLLGSATAGDVTVVP